MKKYISNSVQETEEIAKEVAVKLKGTETIAFYGGLGSGKTTFTAGLVKALESQDDVSSPTFALINEYEGRISVLDPDSSSRKEYSKLSSDLLDRETDLANCNISKYLHLGDFEECKRKQLLIDSKKELREIQEALKTRKP